MAETRTLYNLSAFRLFFCGFVAFSYAIYFPFIRLASNNTAITTHPLFTDLFSLHILNTGLLEYLAVVLIAALICAAIGLGGRLSLVLSAILFTAFEFPLSSMLRPYTTNVVFFGLVILALSPSSCAYNLRQLWQGPRPDDKTDDNWSLPLLSSLLPLVFLNAFISKMLNGGWSWISGETFQAWMFNRYLYSGSAPALFVAKSWPLCLFLSLLTLATELLFGLVVFSKTARKIIVPSAIGFHIGVLIIMRLNFILVFGSMYFIYIDYAYFHKRWFKPRDEIDARLTSSAEELKRAAVRSC